MRYGKVINNNINHYVALPVSFITFLVFDLNKYRLLPILLIIFILVAFLDNKSAFMIITNDYLYVNKRKRYIYWEEIIKVEKGKGKRVNPLNIIINDELIDVDSVFFKKWFIILNKMNKIKNSSIEIKSKVTKYFFNLTKEKEYNLSYNQKMVDRIIFVEKIRIVIWLITYVVMFVTFLLLPKYLNLDKEVCAYVFLIVLSALLSFYSLFKIIYIRRK